MREIQPQTVRARELYGDFWFNSGPVPLMALRGQVILIEFWDYTCGRSLHTLPYMMEWYRKYSPYGLAVVGVHTPKFPFGRDPEQVQRAIARLGITYPVVMDNDALIATQYGNRIWPEMFIVDKNGFVRYEAGGEGGYGSTEHVLQTLLYDAGVGEELPAPMAPVREADKAGAVCYRVSPELFTGYVRGTIGNIEGFSPESIVAYTDPKIYIDGRFYADGRWRNERSGLRLEEDNRPGHIILDYQAMEVNGVLRSDGGKDVEVTVRQDDLYLAGNAGGDDIRFAHDGRSYLVVGDPRMYSVVKNREFGEHVLKLSTEASGLTVFSFMFVSGVIPELISNN